LLGPRQCGKTTLARQFAGQKSGGYFDLENPRDQARLQNVQTARLSDSVGIRILGREVSRSGRFCRNFAEEYPRKRPSSICLSD
jgi:hypothetical protein